MTKGVDYYKREVREGCPVDIYAATNTAMMPYPIRLNNVNESSPTIAKNSEKYILDSSFRDEDIGNAEVVERGEELDAGVIVVADEFGDPEGTTGAVLDMFYELHGREYSPKVMIPLQPGEGTNHVDHYRDLKAECDEFGIDISEHPVAVGGIFQWDFPDQLEAIINVREALGFDKWIHGLGVGFTAQWVHVIRSCPWLLDSIDNSSSYQNVINGKLIDSEFNRVKFARPRGKYSTFLSVAFREATLYMFNYMMGPYIREEDAVQSFPEDMSRRSDCISMLNEHRNKLALKRMFGEEVPL
jgi:hypothetical protein